MRARPRQSVGTIATAANLLIGSAAEPGQAGQARGALSVTVQVLTACGGTVGTGGAATVPAGCPAGSAPLAVLTENTSAPSADPVAPSTARIEDAGELRYVTLIY